MMLSSGPWWWAPVRASGWMDTVPAHNSEAPVAALTAAWRNIPGVWAVLLSRRSDRMTLTPDNLREIPLFLRTYRTMGFDRANFGFVRGVVPAALGRDAVLRDELMKGVKEAVGEREIREVDLLRLTQLGLWQGMSKGFPDLLPVNPLGSGGPAVG